MSNALLLLILIPAVGAAIGTFLPNRGPLARYWALLVSLLTAFAGILLACGYDWSAGKEITLGFTSANPFFLDSIGFGLKLGADAISIWLVLLTVLLAPLSILASFKSIKERPKAYYAWMLALLAAMNGVFIARDLLLFYVFFELTLVPMFFIIGSWGGPDRRKAAGKFFLFTFTGSVFTLAGIIYIGLNNPLSTAHSGGFDLNSAITFAQQHLSSTARFWLLIAFFAGFAVKVPLFPLHTWLPLAHTEAPTAGSVILAGVLLKLGTYGLLKIAVPVAAPDAAAMLAPYIGALCVIGVIYGALVAWVQPDIKKIVAYSSVSHLGFCVLGLFALTTIGLQGSILYMINHGLSTGAMFLCVGMIYDRYHTRDINQLSGLAKVMPRLAFFFILFTLSSIGLPGLNGFVSEFLTILAAFTSPHLGIAYGSFAALGIILGAVYMLHMAARIIWGPLKVPGHDDSHHASVADHGSAGLSAPKSAHGSHDSELPTDLSAREVGLLIPLALAVVILGVYPNIVLNTIREPVQKITEAIPATPGAQTAVAVNTNISHR